MKQTVSPHSAEITPHQKYQYLKTMSQENSQRGGDRSESKCEGLCGAPVTSTCPAWIPLEDNNVGISSLSTYVHYFSPQTMLTFGRS